MKARFRCEADHYGYGWWLAKHLGFEFNPISLRGFQHGWIWWNNSDFSFRRGVGLDPNTSDFFGALVQDQNIERHLTENGIFAKACGLPFLNFYRHYESRGAFASGRSGKMLFIPMHSNPWNDYSTAILESIKGFKDAYGKISVLVGAQDYEKLKNNPNDNINLVRGAGVTDPESFYRLAEAFESHEYVITDSVGSHICYALHCGAKVGIHKTLYERNLTKELMIDTPDNRQLKSMPDFESYLMIKSLSYLDKLFPGLVIDGNLPEYANPPDIAYEEPYVIAKELGWDITYPCEKTKYQRNPIKKQA